MATLEKEKRKTINLYDVLPLYKVKASAEKEQLALISEYEKEKSELKMFLDSLHKYVAKTKQGGVSYLHRDTGPRTQIIELLEQFQPQLNFINELRSSYFTKFNQLPESMLYKTTLSSNGGRYYSRNIEESTDGLTKLNKSHKILGSDVKSLTDTFGFVCIPFSCLHEQAYIREFMDTKREINGFIKLNEVLNVYVITPILYYSLENHVYKNTKELPLYVGRHSTTFTPLTFSIPMFRGMLNTIASVDEKVVELKSQNTQITATIEQMNNTLQNLQRQVDLQQTQIANQNIQLKNMESKMQKFEAEMLRIIDPMLIAFRKDVDINTTEFDNTCCYVGPCWGPDFDEKVSMALDLKIIKNQRSTLTKTSYELWN